MKLSRKAISEGLQSTPIETILLGASTGKGRLTHKQKRFAEEIAKGKSKAAAYREAYDTPQQFKPYQSSEGQRLMQNPLVSRHIDALLVAQEAQKHATPAALRALVIERLTRHALDDDIAPAQRLRALELLGKVTEVAAFTERREVVTHTDPGAARDKLLSALRLALQAGATDAGSLIAELRAPETIDATPAAHIDSPGGIDPTAPTPAQTRSGSPATHLHSVPLIQSSDFSELTPPPSLADEEYGETPPLESQPPVDK